MPAPALRPLSVGEMLDAALKILVRNFLALVKATGVIVIPAALVVAVIEANLTTQSTVLINPTTGQITSSGASTLRGEAVALAAVTLLAALFAYAIVFKIVGDAYVGGQPDWRTALRFTVRRLRSVVWVSVVLWAFLAAVGFVGVFVVVILDHASVVLAVVGGLALVVVLVWLAVPAYLAPPTFMMEGVKGFKAYRRAFNLVRHNWWRTFGLMLLAGLLGGVATAFVDIVFGLALTAVNHSTAGRVLVEFVRFGLTYLFILPFQGAVFVILSIDLRVRKEGYDVQLLAAQLGVDSAGVTLPYVRYSGYPSAQGGGWPGAGTGYPSGGYPPTGFSAGGYPATGYPHAGGDPSSAGGYAPLPGTAGPAGGYWSSRGQEPTAAPGTTGAYPAPSGPPRALGDAPAMPGAQVPATSPPGQPAPGWWMASDGRWYPPELHPSVQAPSTPAPSTPAPFTGGQPAPGWWMASDGRWYPPELHPSVQPPTTDAGTGGAGSPPEPGPTPG